MTDKYKGLIAGLVLAIIGVVGFGFYAHTNPEVLKFIIPSGTDRSGDDAPIVVSGGSLHILTSPDSKGNANKHHYGLGKGQDAGNDPKALYHLTNGANTKDHSVQQVELSYADNGSRTSTSFTPNAATIASFGYCLPNSHHCDKSQSPPSADDVVTVTSDASGLKFVSMGASENDMTADDMVFDNYWNHKPNNSTLSWVAINGTSYGCAPGSIECTVIIHFCKSGAC